jgi:hypothetical protein
MAGCCEYGNEPSDSCATDLVYLISSLCAPRADHFILHDSVILDKLG